MKNEKIIIEQIEEFDQKNSIFLYAILIISLFTVVALGIYKYKDFEIAGEKELITENWENKISVSPTDKASDEQSGQAIILQQMDLKDVDANFMVPVVFSKDTQTGLIGVIDSRFNLTFLYSYPKKFNDSKIIPQPINDEPAIFLSGIGRYGFQVFDFYGNDLSPDRLYYKEGDELKRYLHYPGRDWLVYGLPQLEGDNSIVAFVNYERQIAETIYSEFKISLTPIGWSKDREYLYLWEENSINARLWKMSRLEKKLSPILLGTVKGENFVLAPKSDRALAAVSQNGKLMLKMIDLKSGKSEDIRSVSDVKQLLISSDGNQIFYLVREGGNEVLYHFNYLNKKTQKISDNVYIIGMSDTGGKIAVYEYPKNKDLMGTFSVILPVTLEKISVNLEGNKADLSSSFEPLKCYGPLGYNCWYE